MSTLRTHRLSIRGAALAALAGAWIAVTPDAATAGGAFPVESNAVYRASVGDAQEPAGCYGAGVWLSAWIDLRTGGFTGGGHNLYAQMLRDDGTLVFAGSLVLLRDFDRTVGPPACAFNGSSFMVAWPDTIPGATRIMALRIAPDGTVLDGAPIVVHGGSGGVAVDVASDGDGFLVTYLVSSAGLLAKRIAADGMVLDVAPITICGPTAVTAGPDVAFGHGAYMVAWELNQRLRAARVTPAGTVLDPQGDQVTSFPSVSPNLASNDAGFLMAWTEADDPSFANVGCAVLDPVTMSLGPLQNVTDSSIGHAYAAPVSFGGGGHVVLFHRPEPGSGLYVDLWARRLDAAGVPVGPIFAVSVKDLSSQVAGGIDFNGVEHLAVWEDFAVGGSTASKGGRITTGGLAYDGPLGITLSTGATWQLISGCAFDGTNYLVVWEDWRNGELNGYKSDLYAARVTPSGQVLDDPAIVIAAAGNREAQPHVIFDGEQYLVVWEYGGLSPNSIRASRILPDGTRLDGLGGVEIGEPALPTGVVIRPRAAYNGSQYFVAWHNDYGFAGEVGVVGRFLDRDLVALTAEPIGVATESFTSSTGFDVASDGTDFVVSWMIPNDGGGTDVRATRVSASGTVLGTTTLASSPVYVSSSHVEFNGDHYAVAWSRYPGTIQARMLGTDGVPQGAVLQIQSGAGGLMDMAAHQDTFVVGYLDAAGFRCAQLDGDGVVLADQLIHPVDGSEVYGSGALASGPPGSVLATFSVWADMPFNAPRLFATSAPVAGGVPGDANGDGLVNFADILAVLAAWGPCAGACPADLSGNGVVDFADILVILANWT